MQSHRGLYGRLAFLLLLSLALGLASPARAQTPTPLAGLARLPLIPIPAWTSGAPETGVSDQVASTDVFSFDPSTHTMYFADRTNRGVSAIDTRTNTYVGTIVVPTCTAGLNAAGAGSCPSGVLVAPDVHKLVITDRSQVSGTTTQLLNHIFIFDLRLGEFTPPDGLMLPFGFAPDELDYDPLNQRAYVGNTSAPFFVTVVDLVNNVIVDQIPLPGTVEQPRFDPVDGFVYATVPGAGPGPADHAVLRIDPTQSGAAAIVATFLTPGCDPRGIEIDALTNTAVIGCAGSDPQLVMDLDNNGQILDTFPEVTGTDIEAFNPNVRRWYTASSTNTNSGVDTCPGSPATPTPVFPVVGVFAAPTRHDPSVTLVGVECSGRNGHGIGVDPFSNNLYVGVRQFPADPDSFNTGAPGVLVFHDPAALTQPGVVEKSQAEVEPFLGFTAHTTVHIDDSRLVRARVDDLPLGTTPTVLNITTTIGNEVVHCTRQGEAETTCRGGLRGKALIGGTVLVATGGTPVANGTITRGPGGVMQGDRNEAP
jgi:hypothetical protein